MTHVVIKIDETGRGSLQIDGIDMSNVVSGVSIQAATGEVPRVVLTIPTAPIAAELDADVDLDAETAEALRSLGWVKVDGDGR